MNTIPTTSKRLRVPYTVVGGSRSLAGGALPRSLSIVLLNRGGRPFKRTIFSSLLELGPSEVISVEGPAAQYDIESLSHRYPEVRFLLLANQVTLGERVNIGIEEAKGEFVLILWNDMHIDAGFAAKAFVKLIERPILCVVPVLQSRKNEIIPNIQMPALHQRRLKIIPETFSFSLDRAPTIYPFDFCGLYRKETFALTGGFDHLLKNPYWQKLDFGFRAFMWGEEISCRAGFRMHYLGDLPTDDTSRDESYKLFFLKNLAVRFNRDVGKLPLSQYLRYLIRSGGDLVTAHREFRRVARWVELNQFRFKKDAREVTDLWEMPHS